MSLVVVQIAKISTGILYPSGSVLIELCSGSTGGNSHVRDVPMVDSC